MEESVYNTELTNLPLSSNQKRLWIISQIHKFNPAYNLGFTYHLKGNLNYGIFQNSINILFNRHKTMFSVFKQENGNPYCEILSKPVTVGLIDFSNELPETRKEKIYSFAGEDSRKLFNIETGPLYRLSLLKLNKNEHFFHATIHHLIFDGWSWSIFIHDLSKIYENLLFNRNYELEPLKFYSYNYAGWEKKSYSQEDEDNLITYWKENLKDCPPEFKFPYDFPRKNIPTGLGSKEYIKIPFKITTKLKEFSKKEGSSLFVTLLSILGLLFQKYSGQNDICIGTPFSCRTHPDFENCFGMLVNTVVIRLKIDENNNFRQLINNAKNVFMHAIFHHKLPFEKIVEVVKPERISNMNPLFQTSLAWLNNIAIPMNLSGIKGERITITEGISPFDITFYLWENGKYIEGEIEYNIDILKRETIIRLRDNFLTLIGNLVENPDQTISTISVISENDKKILDVFNKTDVAIPEYLLQNFFERQSDLVPLKTAVISGSERLTYQELESRSNQLARHLITLGVVHGDIVGVCIERSVEMIVSVMGVLKAGGSYLPLDPSYPDDRICYMLEDSGAKVLISQSSFKDKFRDIAKVSFVFIDSERNKINSYSSVKPDLKLDPQSIAYVIYTSGSTGKPKGVRVHHQAVVNFISSMSKRPGIKNNDRLLAVTTLSFDISVLELFLPLSFGAELIIAETEDISDGRKLSELLDMYDITVMQATPVTWNILLSSGWKGKKNLKALCGGEAVQSSLVKAMLPNVESLWNMYGPTETTVWSTCSQLTDSSPPILIGTPIDNTKIFILDKSNNPLPLGGVGEVCIGGLGVSKGYHNRPDLTLEKFISFDKGKIIYKTGDLGKFLTDGNIELFGRIDDQIKIRGFRIEPGEIETLLTQLKGIKESVVKVHRFDDNDERLIAFLNVNTEFKMTNEEIVEAISQKLPPYMVPSFFQKIDSFPRMPNGKINREALHFEIDGYDQERKEDLDLQTETQKKIFNIWEEILKAKNFTGSDNFFDVGGNSLLVIRCINKVKEELGITLTFREFIANPTVDQLGTLIDNEYKSSAKAIELIHLTDTTNLPLSINQKRIWIVCQLQPGIPAYIITNTYQLLGPVNREVFNKSIEILFQRHHILFSTIKRTYGEPYCDIIPTKVNIRFIDYSKLTLKENNEKLIEFIDKDSLKIFDLENGPLYRLYLIKTDTNEYYFHMSIHHIIFDGWSWPVFINDFKEIYNGLITSREIRLEKLEFQQYDYAHWEQTSSHLINRDELIEFWKETLKEAPPILNFPYDFPRKSHPSGEGGLQTVQIIQKLSQKLRKISEEENSSLFATILSTYAILLHKYSGEDDICIGTPVVHRPHSKLENIFGMFVNTIVVSLKFEKDLTFKNVIHLTNEAALDAIAHQDLPFEKIVETVNPERYSNVNPIFQVSFVWQNNLNIPMKMIGIKSKRITGRKVNAIFDITMAMWEKGETIEGEIEYNSDILKQGTIIRLRDNFMTLIGKLLKSPDTSVDSIPMISDEEIKMIQGFTGTRTDYPKEKTIVQLFEEQVDLYPDKPAVVFKEQTLSYRQLNEKTNQLARTLRDLGIKRDIPVGLLVEKSMNMVVGILGILKAGGGYVPIDPEYPVQRIKLMIRDSGCSILITQKEFMEVQVEGVTKIDLNSPDTYQKDKSNVERINSSFDLAYIMYTSGTTGIPKGSLIQQYSVVRLVRNTNYIELTSDDRILLTGAIVFDATTFEIWGALLNGGTLYIVEKETILNLRTLGEELLNNDITILWLSSSLFTQIAESRTDIFAKLKYLLVGGDVLSAPHINKVRKDNPTLKVINGYGPTENTTFSTTYLIEKDFDHNIPIGKPISNTTAYIFDKHLNYQPIGIIGDLYVGGDGLSKGYLNMDDLNRTSFIEHTHIPGERLYRTGDRARWLEDGNIEFHGRIDNQIKIRGFRVEVEEIESVISEIEGIIETVVKPIKIREGDTRLVAFLNVSDTFNMDPKEINRHIKEKLPPYMIPYTYKIMYGFPKTTSGKIDRKALSFNLDELESREINELRTLTSTEKKILDIWYNALKTKDISIIDNFFDIGGNSLLAISVFSKIESAFNIELGLRVFFDNPRINELAETIDITIQKSTVLKSVNRKKESDSKIIKGEI